MTIVGEILAALKAVGVIAEQLGRVADGIHKLRDTISDSRLAKFEGEMDELAIKIKEARTDADTDAVLARIIALRKRNV